MSKADNNVLAKLHGLVAQKLLDRLNNEEWTAQDMAQAIKFLKDNAVMADPELNDAVNKLQEKILETSKLPFPTN